MYFTSIGMPLTTRANSAECQKYRFRIRCTAFIRPLSGAVLNEVGSQSAPSVSNGSPGVFIWKLSSPPECAFHRSLYSSGSESPWPSSCAAT